MYTGYGPTSPPLTNNPFLPQTGQSASSRFPDISNNNNGAVWPNGSMLSGGSFPYQQQTSHQQFPMQNGYGPTSPTGYGSSGMPSGYVSPSASSFPFQTQGYFGQQPQQQQQQNQLTTPSSAPHLSGSSYSYLAGQQSQQPNPSCTPAQQQLHNNPGYIAQFDPYSAIGQGWNGGGLSNNYNKKPGDPNFGVQLASSASTGSTLSTASSSTTSSTTFSGSSSMFGVGPKGDSHPRDYIRAHKTEIEGWDTHAWRQLLNAFEAMKNAWEARKEELMGRAKTVISQGQTGMAYGGYYAQQIQQEATRLQQVGVLALLGSK